MNTTDTGAIVRFRNQLQMSQKRFAKAAGLSLRSTARYESGEKPTTKALSRLSALALAHDIKDLHDIFESELTAALRLRAEKQHSGLASPGKERRIPLQQLMRRAADQEQIRYACRNIFTIAQRLQQKLTSDAERETLVESLNVDVGAVQAIARTALTTSEELVGEDVSFILGPGDNTMERQQLEKYIKYPNTKPEKEAWELIEAYIRRSNSARADAKRLKAGKANLEKEFGDPTAAPAKKPRAKKRA